MGLIIKDGTGKGYEAGVNSNNELQTVSVNNSIQHIASIRDEQSYQAISEISIAASKQRFLTIKNSSDTQDIVITYIRFQSIGATAASESAFFEVELGGDYSSGGSAVTPTNLYVGSANSANAEVYGDGALTMTGTLATIDKNYEANSMQSFNKEGSVVLPKNGSITIAHTGSTAAGTAYARVSFFFKDRE